MSRPSEPSTPPPICTSCGGSGVAFTTHGPFYTSVQKRWRALVEAHNTARREVFRILDLDIGRQVVPLAKIIEKGDVSIADILIESEAAHDKATEAWGAGRKTEAIRLLKKVAETTIYVLESIEAEAQKDAQQP